MLNRPYADAALRYRRAGWAGVIPVGYGPRRKNPPIKGYTGWAGADPSGADIHTWTEGAEGSWNIGLHLPVGIIVPDVDAYNGGDKTLDRLVHTVGEPLPPTWSSTSKGEHSPSRHRFYQATLPAGRVWLDHPGGDKSGIDALHIGHRYAVVWPSIHPSGDGYFWYDPDGELWEDVPKPSELTQLGAAWIEVLSKPGEPLPGTAADDATANAVIRNFRHGQPCRRVVKVFRAEMARIEGAKDRESAGGLHNPGKLYLLAALGLEGHTGVRVALSQHQAAYTAARVQYRGESEQAAAADWWRMMCGAVGKWLTVNGDPVERCDCELPMPPAPPDPVPLTSTGAPGAPAGAPDDVPWPDAPGDTIPVDGDPVDADTLWRAKVREQADRMRLRAEAAELFSAEQHARTWVPPVSYGTLTAELALPDDEQRWRFRGMLGVGHNALIVAGRKTGKTTMVGNVIRSYVDGKPFLDRFDVDDAGAGIAVFNYEVDERQYRRWLRDVGIHNTDRVHVLHLRGRTLPLKHPRVRAWVTAWLRDRGVGMWVVDPYSRAYVGSVDNGNDEAQVGAFLDILDVIKGDAGVSELVMPVHTPKAKAEAGEETAIGSQRLEAWPDSMWYLTRDVESGNRFLRAEGRDVLLPEEQLMYDAQRRALVLSGGGGRAETRRQADVEKLIAYITANPGCGKNSIKEALNFSYATIGELVSAASNKIRIEPGVNRSQKHYLA